MVHRRAFVRAFVAAAGGAAATGLYAWLVEPHWLDLTRRDLPVRSLPGSLHGRTLAHLSDLHVGPRVSERYLIDTLGRVAAERPDIVVCTGDWISYREGARFDDLARVLDRLPRGRLATIGILGNHDYGFGWRMDSVADRVAALATRAGVRMLRNEAASVHGLRFIGLDDFWGPRFDPVGVLSAPSGGEPSVVLCHNPDVADLPVWGGFAGWILAGHTHGGQCKPPFLPPPLLPVRNKRYTSGELALAGGRRMFISRGVGHLIRVRFNVRPEVTLFRLTGDG